MSENVVPVPQHLVPRVELAMKYIRDHVDHRNDVKNGVGNLIPTDKLLTYASNKTKEVLKLANEDEAKSIKFQLKQYCKYMNVVNSLQDNRKGVLLASNYYLKTLA